MRIFLLFFLMVLIASCDPHLKEGHYKPSEDTLINEVTNTTFVKLKNEKELYPYGVGSGGGKNQIRMLAMSFRYYKELDINQARELLMTAGTLYLNTINAKEQIRPFLLNDPFQPKNIGIRIFLSKPNGANQDLDKLTVVAMVDGILDYEVRISETGQFITIYRETFQEAAAKLGIVEENGQYRRVSHLACD